MGYMLRGNPAFRFCFEAVRQGWLGKIFDVYGLMSKMADEDERQRNLRYRGGVMFELGCHLIDPLVTSAGSSHRGYRSPPLVAAGAGRVWPTTRGPCSNILRQWQRFA